MLRRGRVGEGRRWVDGGREMVNRKGYRSGLELELNYALRFAICKVFIRRLSVSHDLSVDKGDIPIGS